MGAAFDARATARTDEQRERQRKQQEHAANLGPGLARVLNCGEKELGNVPGKFHVHTTEDIHPVADFQMSVLYEIPSCTPKLSWPVLGAESNGRRDGFGNHYLKHREVNTR